MEYRIIARVRQPATELLRVMSAKPMIEDAPIPARGRALQRPARVRVETRDGAPALLRTRIDEERNERAVNPTVIAQYPVVIVPRAAAAISA